MTTASTTTTSQVRPNTETHCSPDVFWQQMIRPKMVSDFEVSSTMTTNQQIKDILPPPHPHRTRDAARHAAKHLRDAVQQMETLVANVEFCKGAR